MKTFFYFILLLISWPAAVLWALGDFIEDVSNNPDINKDFISENHEENRERIEQVFVS